MKTPEVNKREVERLNAFLALVNPPSDFLPRDAQIGLALDEMAAREERLKEQYFGKVTEAIGVKTGRVGVRRLKESDLLYQRKRPE